MKSEISSAPGEAPRRPSLSAGIAIALSERAAAFDRQLARDYLPYWYDTAVDWKRGGFVLADDALHRTPPAREKQLVTQARMIWGFSHAVVCGYGESRRDYLAAARQGVEFLEAHFHDPNSDGYFWKTDPDGAVMLDRKYLYGQAFVIYGFIEYFRASGDRSALDRALALHQTVQLRAHDPKNGGWIEHFTARWQPILRNDALIETDEAGAKSGNGHLHWMEALAELYAATGSRDVESSVVEALRINRNEFFPADANRSASRRTLDWRRRRRWRSPIVQYGHRVEFAWLMIHAQRHIGEAPAWEQFDSILDGALSLAFDHEEGGLYAEGRAGAAAKQSPKIWWVQAEMMAALTEAVRHRPTSQRRYALEQLVDFLVAHGIDPSTGVWYETVGADGKPASNVLASNWKANYHDFRAMTLFIDAFKER